jgi:hypothetical protein
MMTQLPATALVQAEIEEEDARQLAADALTEVMNAEARADGKACDLLGFFGVLTVATVALASKAGLPAAVTVTLWVAAAPMVAAWVRLLLVVRPPFTGDVSFARYALRTTQTIAADFRADGEAFLAVRADRIRVQSAAVVRKYRGIRIAVHLVLLGGAGLVVALALAVVA